MLLQNLSIDQSRSRVYVLFILTFELILILVQFNEAGLHPMMVKNIELCGYQVPTPIQAYTIPAVLTGRDVIGIAQTGMEEEASSDLIAY